MKIGTNTFGGMVPRAEPHLLTDSQAQLAVNAKVWRGALQPLHANAFIVGLAKPGTKKTIYRFGRDLDSDTQYWFHWLNDTDVASGPIPDDPNERTYYTEAGQPPKVTDASIALGGTTYPVVSYLLGLPTPALSALTTVGGTGVDGAIAQTTSVVYTYVSAWGEEGPPSAASTLTSLVTGQTLTVTNMSGPPSGAHNVAAKRIYVANTASGTAAYQFWAEIPVANDAYSAVLNYADLAESISDPYLSPPPTDLFGILAHPNGFMIGFSGKRVCRSEVNMPHGWPAAYTDPVAHLIVGGAMIGTSCVVCTQKKTYLGVASDPINWQLTELEINQPCVSKRSIVEADGSVLYASPDGLISVGGDGTAVNVTDAIFTPDQWQAYKPESISAYFFKGSYLAFYDNGSTQGGFVIDAKNSEVYNLGFFATAGYSDPRRNALFLAIGDNVVRFDPISGTSTDLLWRSKRYLADKRGALCGGRVISTQYPVTLRLYADNTLVHTETVANKSVFAMKSGYRAREFYYEIEFSVGAEVSEAACCTTQAEFAYLTFTQLGYGQ